ncbi:hypothetical protein tb265_00060 [Gemmatimonadetes bacterium T265]|nr:hypothetical protein tb265_00060 [Gemmatimonadetes bacterium T265]
MPPDAPAPPAVVPIRVLAYDGDAAFVVERASAPPVTAAQRFRADAAPVAARVAEQVRAAQNVLAGAALDANARAAVGDALRRAVVALRALAESYEVTPVADVCRAREAGAAALDPRAVAGVEHVASGLLGGAARERAPDGAAPNEPPPAGPGVAGQMPNDPAAADAAPAPAFRPPTGPALVELLEHGITGLERWPGTPLDVPAVPAPAAAPDGVVPIEALCYRGRAALDRARAVRDLLRAEDGAPDAALLAELYDLLDLAASD